MVVLYTVFDKLADPMNLRRPFWYAAAPWKLSAVRMR